MHGVVAQFGQAVHVEMFAARDLGQPPVRERHLQPFAQFRQRLERHSGHAHHMRPGRFVTQDQPLRQRAMQESTAGIKNVDIIHTSDAGHFELLRAPYVARICRLMEDEIDKEKADV